MKKKIGKYEIEVKDTPYGIYAFSCTVMVEDVTVGYGEDDEREQAVRSAMYEAKMNEDDIMAALEQIV